MIDLTRGDGINFLGGEDMLATMSLLDPCLHFSTSMDRRLWSIPRSSYLRLLLQK